MAYPYQVASQFYNNFLGSKNYPGSSGYWNDPTGAAYGSYSRYGLGYPGDVSRNQVSDALGLSGTTGTTVGANTEVPVLGADGKFYSTKTGKLFTGADSTGNTYNNGFKQSDVKDRYQAVDVTKDPAVADETSKLLDSFKSDAASALKDFNSHLSDFSADTSGARAKGAQATDISGFETGMNQRQAALDKSLNQSVGDYANLNADQATKENAIVKQAFDILPQYDAAAAAIADRQAQALQANMSRYKLGTDTPRSLSGVEQNILARNVADVYLPMEQQKIARNLDLVTNLSLPVSRELYGNEANRISNFNPKIAQQEFASGQATLQTIQGVRQQVAAMSYDDATRYMQSLGVPAQIQQQILSGQLGQLGQIAGLNDATHYRGLQDLAGAYPSQPVYYNMGTPGYGGASYPGRYGITNTGNTLGGNAPTTVSPQNGDWSYDQNASAWVNRRTGQYSRYGNSQGTGPTSYQFPYPTNQLPQAGSMSGGRYDPNTGMIVDGQGNWLNSPVSTQGSPMTGEENI